MSTVTIQKTQFKIYIPEPENRIEQTIMSKVLPDSEEQAFLKKIKGMMKDDGFCVHDPDEPHHKGPLMDRLNLMMGCIGGHKEEGKYATIIYLEIMR